MRNLDYLKKRADADLAYAEKVLAAANADPSKTDQAKAAAQDVQQKAAAKAEALGTQLDAAKADAKAKQDAVAAAQAAAKAAEAKRIETAKAATDAKLAGEPVSIFISRATQKLYVRRDTHKQMPDGGEMYDTSLEFPVTIKDPDKPIGTHIFTAVARDERAVCAGPKSRSTTATTPRTRSTASPSRRRCSTGSRPPHCRCPRSPSPMSR